jgi:hypothetical protein
MGMISNVSGIFRAHGVQASSELHAYETWCHDHGVKIARRIRCCLLDRHFPKSLLHAVFA